MASSDVPAAAVPGPKPAAQPGAGGRRMRVLILVIVVVVAAAFGAGYLLFGPNGLWNPGTQRNRAPVAVIATSKASPVTYDTITLNASGSSDPDGGALSYAWQLPNGSASHQVAVNYTFTSVGVFSFALTVTDPQGLQDTAHLDVTVRPAPLTVGTNIPYAPFEFYNGTAFAGFDIDLADAMATQAGYAAQWQNFVDFSVLLSTVGSGGVDMAASAITSSGLVGAVRNNTMYFSTPYFYVDFGVLVHSWNNLTCALAACTPGILANRTIGVVGGTTAADWVQTNLVATNLTPSSKVSTYADVTHALAALEANVTEILFTESYVSFGLASASNGTLRIAGLVSSGEMYSFAFPKNAAGFVLRERMDTAFQAVVQSGVYGTLYAKWFLS